VICGSSAYALLGNWFETFSSLIYEIPLKMDSCKPTMGEPVHMAEDGGVADRKEMMTHLQEAGAPLAKVLEHDKAVPDDRSTTKFVDPPQKD
jgi:hypothetical protein